MGSDAIKATCLNVNRSLHQWAQSCCENCSNIHAARKLRKHVKLCSGNVAGFDEEVNKVKSEIQNNS